MSNPIYIGGSFAPPLSDEKIAAYTAAISALPASPVKDACASLLVCCEKWWGIPEPVGTKIWDHPSGTGKIVAMQADHVKDLDPHVPWDHELEAMQGLFDAIPDETQRGTRNMAFHLLWYVKEMSLGREPLTIDKL